MKVGDKVVCIKTRLDFNLENNIYTILKIDSEKNEIIVSVEKSIYHICCHYSSVFDRNKYVFNDFFVTLKSKRKEKIQKINENM